MDAAPCCFLLCAEQHLQTKMAREEIACSSSFILSFATVRCAEVFRDKNLQRRSDGVTDCAMWKGLENRSIIYICALVVSVFGPDQ